MVRLMRPPCEGGRDMPPASPENDRECIRERQNDRAAAYDRSDTGLDRGRAGRPSPHDDRHRTPHARSLNRRAPSGCRRRCDSRRSRAARCGGPHGNRCTPSRALPDPARPQSRDTSCSGSARESDARTRPLANAGDDRLPRWRWSRRVPEPTLPACGRSRSCSSPAPDDGRSDSPAAART